jgi:hypothetical protein
MLHVRQLKMHALQRIRRPQMLLPRRKLMLRQELHRIKLRQIKPLLMLQQKRSRPHKRRQQLMPLLQYKQQLMPLQRIPKQPLQKQKQIRPQQPPLLQLRQHKPPPLQESQEQLQQHLLQMPQLRKQLQMHRQQ